MEDILRFALLGLGAGAIYVLAAQGLVLIYRGSGTINFAHGAMALLSAGVFVELHHDYQLPLIIAGAIGIAVSALIGFLMDYAIMRRISSSSPLARMVVTLGVLAIVESTVILRYGSGLRFVEQYLPSQQLTLWGETAIGADRLILCAVAIVATFLLWAMYNLTEFGRQTTAVTESPRSAAAVGISPNRISQLNWTLGSAMAGLAGILFVPLTGLMPVIFVLLIIPMLATALVGNFTSFPLTLAGGLIIGIAQSLISYSGAGTGWPETIPLLIIIAVLVFRGHALPLRGYLTDKLPAARGTSPPGLVGLVATLATVVLIYTTSTDFVNAIAGSLIAATIILSIVLLTGFTGQVSLGQYAFVGMGAFVSARLADLYGISFPVAFLIGVLFTVPVGLLFALPALRTRGINLAIVTLGLGFALDSLVFKNKDLTGGFEGTTIDPPALFGLSLDSIAHPERYALATLVLFVLCALMVINLRRGTVGRRLLATRSNERAAAALGISVTGAKLYAFALAAGIAAAAGVLDAFRFPNVRFDVGYSNFESVPAVLMAFLGGIGFIGGAVIGGLMSFGGVMNELLTRLIELNEWQGMVIGIGAIVIVLAHPDGLAEEIARRCRHLTGGRLAGRKDSPVPSANDGEVMPCPPQTLGVEGVTVRFGGVVALNEVGFEVPPGRVTGLIGPNGAGKTTLIDTITGFARPSAGEIRLGDRPLATATPAQRARLGLSRTFQNLELFSDLTVGDNIRVACDPRHHSAYLRDLVSPPAVPFPPSAARAIEVFGLGSELHRKPDELSFGQRRLLGIARAVAANPSVLLLDEPAAGLDPEETGELRELIRALADTWGMAVLLVEHDMDLVMKVCDHIVVLDFGNKLAEGDPASISADSQVRAAYLGEDDSREEVEQ